MKENLFSFKLEWRSELSLRAATIFFFTPHALMNPMRQLLLSEKTGITCGWMNETISLFLLMLILAKKIGVSSGGQMKWKWRALIAFCHTREFAEKKNERKNIFFNPFSDRIPELKNPPYLVNESDTSMKSIHGRNFLLLQTTIMSGLLLFLIWSFPFSSRQQSSNRWENSSWVDKSKH